MASFAHEESIPNIIAIGLPNVNALVRAQNKLLDNHIAHFAWVEPDGDLGFTAIATAPLDDSERMILKNYRVWSDRLPVVLNSTLPSKGESLGVTPSGQANL